MKVLITLLYVYILLYSNAEVSIFKVLKKVFFHSPICYAECFYLVGVSVSTIFHCGDLLDPNDNRRVQ